MHEAPTNIGLAAQTVIPPSKSKKKKKKKKLRGRLTNFVTVKLKLNASS